MPQGYNFSGKITSTGVAKIFAPNNQLVQIDAATVGKDGDINHRLGIVTNGDKTCTEHEAIESDGGGEIKGPWTIDEDLGLIASSDGKQDFVVSFLGRMIQ